MFVAMVLVASCNPFLLAPIENHAVFAPRLSAYRLYADDPRDLLPGDSVTPYELQTPLFTDYASKHRMVRLPDGGVMQTSDGGEVEFPEGTLLVKTFYYNTVREMGTAGDPHSERRLVETRLLKKSGGYWSAATYQWNSAQDDAVLLTRGATIPLQWEDDMGHTRTTRYEIPSTADCAACHRSRDRLIPLGPRLRNLQVPGVLPGVSAQALPRWDDPRESLERRARAYLDVNCAHCHQPNGWARATGLYLGYELPLKDTRILQRRRQIERRLLESDRSRRMPRLGTTIPHVEGIALIRSYLAQLKP